jgi:hypothetical protein
LLDERLALRSAALFVAGAAVALMILVSPWFVAGRVQEFWFANVTYNLAYSEGDALDRLFAAARISDRVLIGGLWLWVLSAIGVAWLCARRIEAGHAAVIACAAAAMAGASLTGREYAHYWVPLTPFLALLAATALLEIIDGWSSRRTSVAAAAIGCCGLISIVAVAEIYGADRDGAHLLKYNSAPAAVHDLAADELSAYVESHTLPRDRIFVFGVDSQPFAMAGRRPATYFTRPVAAFGVHGPSFERTMAELEAGPPKLILDTARTSLDGAAGPGTVVEGEVDLAPEFREPFDRFVAEYYEYAGTVAYARVYVLKP